MKKYLLLLALVCLLGNRALAEDLTIDFSTFGGSGQPNATLGWENTNHPTITQNGNKTTFSNRFWVNNPNDWGFYGSSTFNQTYLQKKNNTNNTKVSIGDMKTGDVVTIWGESGDQGGGCNVTSNNIKNSSSGSTNLQFSSGTPSHTFTMSSDGTLELEFYNRYSGIRKITVQSQQQQQQQTTRVFNYDPGFEVYDMFEVKTSNGVSYSTSDAGFTLNGGNAQYINLNNANITLNERIAVNPTSGWSFNRGLQAPNYDLNNNNWYNFSICNLKEGDRVEIFWTGDAPTFSSQGQGSAYNGSQTFLDENGDGILNNGDHIVSQGEQLRSVSERDEGTLAREENVRPLNIYTSSTYVISQDGHLDLGIKNGNRTRIVKIKIYSDHQATMVDYYNQPNKTYGSVFDITGELQAKEHIVPGGLEVHVGNNDPTQHAIVVASKYGPMSYVNAVDRFKIPGITKSGNNIQINFNLKNEIPQTGTFYKFIAQEEGDMTVKFQGNSIYYYRYDLTGDAIYYNTDQNHEHNDWRAEFDRANEQTFGQPSTYYLMEEGSNGAPIQKVEKSVANGSAGEITYHLEKGKVYYLYGVWSEGAALNDRFYIKNPDEVDKQGKTPYTCGVAELYDVEFTPTKKIHPLAKWVPNGTTADEDLADVTGYADSDLRVKLMTGNITGCTPYIQGGKLKIKDITFATDNSGEFKNRGGVILIKVGDVSDRYDPVYAFTVAYSADPQYDKENADGSRGHTWDFSTNSLNGLEWTSPYNANGAVATDFGTYFNDYFASGENSGVNSQSLLAREMNYTVNNVQRSDWMLNYRIQRADGTKFDPRFLNKYDMEGDNADMLYDTEGIIIEASSNQSCIFNEFKGDIHASANDPDRYVGILPGGTFRIPWLEANDRVIIWMGSGVGTGNEQMVFNITNARDAEYKEIDPNDEYIAGGSQWNGANNDNNYRGCYHFFAKEKGDMIFQLATEGSSMCKIYKIQIYRGDRINTNEIKGATNDDKFLLTSTDVDPNDANSTSSVSGTYNWTLQYFGKDQKIADGSNSVSNSVVARSGVGIPHAGDALTTSTETDPTAATYNTFTYQHALGQIGTFRMRGKDMEKNMKYVADYGEHNVTVAYQQTMKYPYTWDFRDVTGWGNNSQNFSNEDAIGSVMVSRPSYFDSDNDWDASYEKSSKDLSLWELDVQDKTTYYLRLNSQSGQTTANLKVKDNIFETAKAIDGNQYWANGFIVPETQGLWFYSYDNNRTYNTWGLTNDGLAFNGQNKSILNMVVPNVPAGAAVYLRMETNGDFSDQAYLFKGGNTNCEVYGPILVDGTTNEYIYAILNKGAKRHLTFSISGYQLKKIAVSTDPKAIGKTGYATESRAHRIDHTLTSYLTGKNIKAYIADYNSDYSKVLLKEIGSSNTGNKMNLAPSAEDDNNACILYHDGGSAVEGGFTDRTVNLFDSGLFHVFVPDMHDAPVGEETTNDVDVSGNILKSYLPTASSLTLDGLANTDRLAANTISGYTNMILSATKYSVKDANSTNTANGYDVFFIRIDPKKGASMKKCSAYIQMDTDELVELSSTSNNGSGAKMSIVFADDWFGEINNGIATGIDQVTSNKSQVTSAEWYNLNGQKLNGMPTEKGLYIVNGRKVLVK